MKLALIWLALAVSASAQMQDNRDKTLTCDYRDRGDRSRHCDIREQSLPGVGRLTVDDGFNGGATVKGWLRNDVLVRARVDAWAESDAEAAALAAQVQLQIGAGQVKATGPEQPQSWHQSSWSVSYEIFVPQNTDLNLKTNNGGIRVSDVRGLMEFAAQNGGVHLSRIAGDVTGSTVNGGVHLELAGASWEGRRLEVRTQNGGVTISVPESYSAHLQMDTVNGGLHSDFPLAGQGRIRTHNLDFNLGSGGPLIHVATTNGGVHLKRI